MPSAPSATVAEFTLPSPSASSATLAEVSLASPSAPAATVADASEITPPDSPDPAAVSVPKAVMFEPVFVPELPNSNHLRTVPGLTISGRPVFTSSGTAANALEDLLLVQDEPIDGIWVTSYYNGTVWRTDVWYDGELMLYWQSSTFAFANPWSVSVWDFGDNPGVYPDASWNPAQLNAFEITATAAGCVIVPTYSPGLGSEPLLLVGLVEGRPWFAKGADLAFDGESLEGFDVALTWDPGGWWQFGELGTSPTWIFSRSSLAPPLGQPSDQRNGECKGNIRLLEAAPDATSRAVAAYTAPTPSAPSATV